MAHEVFAIEKLGGMVTNQPSRISGNPIRVVADFDRVGGYSPLRRIYESVTDEDFVGNDWTGVYATVDSAGGPNMYVGYAQTGARRAASATLLNTAGYTSYVPGAGIYTISASSFDRDRLLNPGIVAAVAVDSDGNDVNIRQNSSPTFAPSISIITGAWDAGSKLFVLFIYFYKTPHGLIPFAMFAREMVAGANKSGWRITKSGFYSDDAYYLAAYYYVKGTISGQEYVFHWHRAYHDVDADSPYSGSGDTISSNLDLTTNASPTLYGTRVFSPSASLDFVHDFGHQRYHTVSVGRAFYVNKKDVVHMFKYDESVGWVVLERLTSSDPTYETAYTKQNVFFTDVGHLAFSDSEESPLNIVFDDRIHSITTSNRGIYAFSTLATWEAYGDFETINTRVSLVPVLGGADLNVGNPVTFSGDTAYFLKEGIIHSLGPGGVRQIGRDIYMESDDVYYVAYDRYRRRLLAMGIAGEPVYEYDPNTKQWLVWPKSSIPGYSASVHQRAIFPTANDRYWSGGRDVLFSPTPPPTNIEVEYGKLDMGKPLLRKRIHRIIIPYHGSMNSITVDVRRDHLDTYVPCTVNDRGEYVEVRCPSVVSRSFDIRVIAEPASEDFMLSPPWIIEYDVRGAPYGKA